MRRFIAVVVFVTIMFGYEGNPCSAGNIGDNRWNLRQNAQDFFHSNESIVVPWRFNHDDGHGRFEGNHSYQFAWTDLGTSGDGSGSFAISRGRDHQFSAWCYIYLDMPGLVTLSGGGDCVPRAYIDLAFSSPLVLPASVYLSAGVHRVDLTGYNQNDGYNAFFPRPVGITEMGSTPDLPTPSVMGVVSMGLGSLALRRRRNRGDLNGS